MSDDTTHAKTIWQRLAALLDDYFFRPLGPTRLGVCRIVYYLALFWLFFGRASILNPNPLSAVQMPEEFFFPQNVFRYIPIASSSNLDLLTILLKISLLLAAVGLLTRVFSVVAFGLLFYLLSVPGMYGKLFLIYAVPIIVTGVLALSRSGDALSLDRVIHDRWRRWPLVSADPQPSAHYRWPIQVICVYLVMVFFFAGMSKLVDSGLHWALSNNLSLLLQTTQQNQACLPVGGGGRIPELASWLADQHVLTRILALGTLCVELGSPLALRSGLVRYLALGAMATSILSFYFLVGPDAWPILFVFCFFMPWELWWEAWRRRRASPPSAA